MRLGLRCAAALALASSSGHAQTAVDADHLTVDVLVLHDALHQMRVLIGVAQSAWVRHCSAQLLLRTRRTGITTEKRTRNTHGTGTQCTEHSVRFTKRSDSGNRADVQAPELWAGGTRATAFSSSPARSCSHGCLPKPSITCAAVMPMQRTAGNAQQATLGKHAVKNNGDGAGHAPSFASSRAMGSVMPTIAPLEAEYAAWPI